MSSQPSNFRRTDVKRDAQAMQAAGLKHDCSSDPRSDPELRSRLSAPEAQLNFLHPEPD
jgi:hypothetical protein